MCSSASGTAGAIRAIHRSSSQSSPRSGFEVKTARGGGGSRGVARAKLLEHAIGDDLAAAAGQPARDRSRVIGAGRDQGRAIPGEPPQIARLFQIAGRIVQPEQPALRRATSPITRCAAIADVEIAGARNPARQRRPAHALVAERGAAAVAHLDPMAAPRQAPRRAPTKAVSAPPSGPASAIVPSKAMPSSAITTSRHQSGSSRALR